MTDTHRPEGADPSDAPPGPALPGDGRPSVAGTARPGVPHRPHGHDDGPPSYETGGLRLALLVGSFVALGLIAGWPVLVMILGVVVMIFLHELGHFVTAKWSGMKVTEFFIGFGPRIWSFRRGETEYGLKVVPAGAYVRIIGMNNLDDVETADEPRTYRQQSFPKRLLVVSAGSLMHFAQAFVLLVVLLGVVGFPGGSISDPLVEAWDVGEVVDGSAADAAGLRVDDRIVEIDGRPASSYDDFSAAILAHDVGDEIRLTVVRDGDRRTAVAELRARPESEGGDAGTPFLGIATSEHRSDVPMGLGTALVRAPGEMLWFSGHSLGALAGFFSPEGISDFADNLGSAGDEAPQGSGDTGTATDDGDGRLISIIGFVQIGSQDVADRAAFMLFLFFQVNMFVGIFNMLPLLPLDGGHAVMAIYERIRSRPGRPYHADFAKLLPLTYAVVMVLVFIGITTMYLDIINPIDV